MSKDQQAGQLNSTEAHPRRDSGAYASNIRSTVSFIVLFDSGMPWYSCSELDDSHRANLTWRRLADGLAHLSLCSSVLYPTRL